MCEDTQLLLKRTLYRARKLMQLRQEDESVKEFIRAMALARIVHGDTHWRYARAQIFLAHVYLDMKSYYIQADDHASEALCNLYNNFCMEELPQKKTQVLFTLFLGNLVRGEANTHLRNYSQAEKCLQEAAKYLEDWDESLRNVPRRCADMEDFQKWRIRMNLSLARLWRKKKPALMMQHYHNALEDTRERYKGRGHKVILILQEIGEAIVETCPREQIADSIIYLEEAVHVAKESYDEDSVEVARSRHILVRACMNLDEPQELLLLATLERVERIFKEQLGLQHPDTLRVLKDIVEILLSLEDFEEILPRLQLLVKYENVVFGEVAEETRDTLKKLARVYMKMDQPDEAVRCLQRCVNTDTLLFGANDKKTKATQRSLDLLLRNSRSLAALDNMEQKRRGSAQ